MVIFCGVVDVCSGDLCDDWSSKVSLGCGFGGFGGFTLSFIVVKDSRTILSADVRALTIQSCGVMRAPEPIKQSLITYYFWVVMDLCDFGMSGSA